MEYFDKFAYAEMGGLGIVFEALENVYFFTHRNIGMHMHMVFELYILQEGKAQVATENGTYILTPGEVALIPPKVYHSLSNVGSSFRLISVSFQLYKVSRLQNGKEKQISDILDKLLQSSVVLLGKQPKITDTLQMLLQARNEQDAVNSYLMNAYAMELLVYLIRALPPALGAPSGILNKSNRQIKAIELDRMKVIENYIYEHYTDGNITDLAEMLSLSEQHVRRFLRTNYDIPFSQLMNRHRVNVSKKMLITSDMSISEIWKAVGFHSVQNFTIAFKKYTGVPPAEYRQQNIALVKPDRQPEEI